jgi:hypothetical protein
MKYFWKWHKGNNKITELRTILQRENVEQEYTSVFSGIFSFCILFCRSLFSLFRPLCCLSAFNLLLQSTSLVSSNSSSYTHPRRVSHIEQELRTLPEHLSSPFVFKEDRGVLLLHMWNTLWVYDKKVEDTKGVIRWRKLKKNINYTIHTQIYPGIFCPKQNTLHHIPTHDGCHI